MTHERMGTKLQEAREPGGSSNILLCPKLKKDHPSVAWRRAPWLYHLVSRFLAEAANTRTDLLLRLWCFSKDLLPFNQKPLLSSSLPVPWQGFMFSFCQRYSLLFSLSYISVNVVNRKQEVPFPTWM